MTPGVIGEPLKGLLPRWKASKRYSVINMHSNKAVSLLNHFMHVRYSALNAFHLYSACFVDWWSQIKMEWGTRPLPMSLSSKVM